MTTNEKQPPPSLEELLAELRAEVSRLASATATGATYMGRAVKAMETGHSAGSRALTQAAERIERSTSGAQRVLTKTERLLDRAAAEPSITVVRDVPALIEPEKSGKDDTGVFLIIGGHRRKIPTKAIVPLSAVAGGLAHWFGAHWPGFIHWLGTL